MFGKKLEKKLCSQIISLKNGNESIMVTNGKSHFFRHPALTFCKMDIFKMSKIDLAPPDWKK
jgi:hypothetical protein